MNDILALVYGYARALWHRRWWAAIAAWIVCVIAWTIVLLLPEKYEATARVYVDARTPLKTYVKDIAIEQDFSAQLALVREALLSRPQLEAVARKTNLDAGVTTTAGMDALVGGLQTQIQVIATSVSGANNNNQQSNALYTISYRHPQRDKSVEVVRTLLDNFVEGTLSGNRSGASEAQSFLVTEIKELERRLAEAEARLAEFKKNNVGMLPGERGDFYSRLETEMNGLSQAQTNLAVALSRREELQRQLAAARQFTPGTSSSSGGTGTPGASADVSTRVQESEARLEELLLKFTNKHPEVIALRETIKELRDRETKEMAELSRGGQGTGAIRSLSVNPVYQSIQLQMNQVEVDIASLRGGVAQHEREVAALSRLRDSAPEVEQEFSRLNRDYSVLKTQYEALVARSEQARVTDNAAQSGIVRFEVIEPPRAAQAPVWPNRRLFMAAALFCGLAAGVAFALLPHFLRPTFDNTASLARLTGLPVLGAVSLLRRPAAALETRREVQRLAIVCAALVMVGVGLVAFGNASARAIQSLLA
jgi:polysaccharide chain length determinant protein (PEP-CTERM system associated)